MGLKNMCLGRREGSRGGEVRGGGVERYVRVNKKINLPSASFITANAVLSDHIIVFTTAFSGGFLCIDATTARGFLRKV